MSSTPERKFDLNKEIHEEVLKLPENSKIVFLHHDEDDCTEIVDKDGDRKIVQCDAIWA
jgi:hypothetical protein